MRFHVQFLGLNTKNKVDEVCGSDGVFILDGRNSLRTMTFDAIKRFHQMSKIHSDWVGWRIKRGSRFDNSTVVKEWIKSETPSCKWCGLQGGDCTDAECLDQVPDHC